MPLSCVIVTRLDSQESTQFSEICYLLAKLQVSLTDIYATLSVIRSQKTEQVSIVLYNYIVFVLGGSEGTIVLEITAMMY